MDGDEGDQRGWAALIDKCLLAFSEEGKKEEAAGAGTTIVGDKT